MKRLRAINMMIMALAVILMAGFSSCKKEKKDGPPDELAFIGSDKCAVCHQAIYDKFIESGHPYKLSKVEGAQPVIPFTTAAGLTIPTPTGYTWSDITYMIGGYGWKARFLDSNGFIITELPETQFNIADHSQVIYESGTPVGTKKYNCGRCHTTGWKSVADGGVPQDGLAGMDGEFFAGGVHCEKCHGMGNMHEYSQDATDISIDATAAACGACHYRNSDHTIAASGGFIKHHEQYDELISGPHATITGGCTACHDPHSSVVYDSQAKGEGVTKACTDCYSSKAGFTHNGATCTTCHMPLSSKSALKTGDYTGDIATHIFAIDTRSDGVFFSPDGSLANVDGLGVTLDRVCYQCHTDEQGLGGGGSVKTMTALSAKATGIHNTK